MYNNECKRQKKLLTAHKLLPIVFLIWWFVMNLIAELACSQGFFLRGLFECMLLDGVTHISSFGVSSRIDFFVQCVPLFFGLYYIRSEKNNKLNSAVYS